MNNKRFCSWLPPAVYNYLAEKAREKGYTKGVRNVGISKIISELVYEKSPNVLGEVLKTNKKV